MSSMTDPTLQTAGEPEAGRVGDWMQTYSGQRFYPLDPRPEEIHPEDIAHALSMICRYGGHVKRFYSVAEHCWRMSYKVHPEDALWALLHDASEAYVGDMVRPLKRHMPHYRAAEEAIQIAIAKRFGLTWPYPADVVEADNRIVNDERHQLLMPTSDVWFTDLLQPLGVTLVGYQPQTMQGLYLQRLYELWSE